LADEINDIDLRFIELGQFRPRQAAPQRQLGGHHPPFLRPGAGGPGEAAESEAGLGDYPEPHSTKSHPTEYYVLQFGNTFVHPSMGVDVFTAVGCFKIRIRWQGEKSFYAICFNSARLVGPMLLLTRLLTPRFLCSVSSLTGQQTRPPSSLTCSSSCCTVKHASLAVAH
jgi:hypothetical protein